MKKKFLIASILFAIVISGRLSYVYFYEKPRHEEIVANMKITLGEITEVNVISFKGPKRTSITYQYQINGRVMIGQASFAPDEKYHLSRELLLFKKYPVVYSEKNIEVSDIIIVHEDSVKYHLLRW